jgi:hypothetical protein
MFCEVVKNNNNNKKFDRIENNNNVGKIFPMSRHETVKIEIVFDVSLLEPIKNVFSA